MRRATTAMLAVMLLLTGCDSAASGEQCFEWSMNADAATTVAERDRWVDRLHDGGCL